MLELARRRGIAQTCRTANATYLNKTTMNTAKTRAPTDGGNDSPHAGHLDMSRPTASHGQREVARPKKSGPPDGCPPPGHDVLPDAPVFVLSGLRRSMTPALMAH